MDKYIELYRIAAEFRGGIEQALDSGEFLEDIFFRNFPTHVVVMPACYWDIIC